VTIPTGLIGSVTTAALASATAVVGSLPSVAAIFVSMTTKKLAVGSAALIGVAGLTTFVYQSNRTDDPKVSLATVSSVRSVVANEPEQRASTANQLHALTERSIGEGDAAVKAGIVAWNSGKHQLPERRRLDKEAMQKDPRYPAHRAKGTDRWVELSYGAAFKQLGLSQTQIHRMRQLLAQRELSLVEFDSLAGTSSASKESLGTARQSAVSGIDAEIAGLIGMNYEQLKALRQRGGSSIFLHSEAIADLSIAGCPLRPEQSNALALIYHQRKPLPSAPASSMGLPADLQQMFDMAQHNLSPTQLAVFLETLRTKAKFEQLIADHMVAPN
jgi:hypothetical protein